MNHFISDGNKIEVKQINLYEPFIKKVPSTNLKVKLPSYRTSHCTSGMSVESSLKCDKTFSQAENSIVLPLNKPEVKPIPSKQFNTEKHLIRD